MTTHTRIKICGITSHDDALDAVEAGVDAIGLVFFEKSARHVSIDTAAEIADSLPPFISKVALFVNAEQAAIDNVLANVPIDLLQFHGQEAESSCAIYSKPYIKAIRMSDDVNIEHQIDQFNSASGLLLDTYVKGQPGGTGLVFDWKRIPSSLTKPVILAGGLTPDNVANAISQVRPYAVDVSGGVESSPGKKDIVKMNQFIREARNA